MKNLIKFLAFAGVLTVVGAASTQANLIANGNFTANSAAFTVYPGYTGGGNPAAITGWLNYLNVASQGLNGAGTGAGNPFGPTNPGGRTYAFLQHGQQLLGQYLPTLAPNTQYKLDYDVACRGGYSGGQYRVVVSPSDTAGFNGLYYDSGLQTGNSAAFDHITAYFTTPAMLGASPNIQLWNETGSGDYTIDYANVSLSLAMPDTTPPSITCPVNVTVNADAGKSYATGVALFTATASDNSGSVTVWSNAPAQFNKGVTTVIWTAQDPSGNTATCAQTVTVTDSQLGLALVRSNQQARLTITGGSGRAQRIESSTNLSAWTTLATVPQTNGTLQWVDFAAMNLPQRFYRSLKLTALDTYVATPDPNYTYSLVNTIPGAGQTTFILAMTSQAWLTTNEVNQPLWKHWLIIVKPNGVTYSKALLCIYGGNNTDPVPTSADPTRLQQIALDTQSVVAELRTVPYQPLTFAGESFSRSEDAMMAYTWDKFLRTGDDKWPLLLPMTKAAVRAMDTVTTFCSSAPGGGINVDAFVVTGASKRGWTTWTTAIVDRRVVAIIPVVIDLLNLVPSFIHHYSCYGGWAPAIQDYVNMGVMDRLTTPEFGALMKILDPYEYRARLTLPKFMINASGDQFFLPDSSQFYFDDLLGVKYLRYVPNIDHGLGGDASWPTIEACYQAVLTSAALPQFSWTLPSSNSIRVVTTTSPSSVKLWQATNPNARDFRLQTIGAAWQSTPLADQGGGVYVGTVPAPPQGFTAFFVELTYPGSGVTPFTFTTRVKVVPDIEPYSYPP